MTSDEYVAKVRRLQRSGLLKLWTKITNRNATDWGAGKALEYLVLRAFEIERATIEWPYSVYDPKTNHELEQIDGVIYAKGLSAIIEVKDYNDGEQVDFGAIGKLRSRVLRRPHGVLGVVFSRTGFTPAAIEETRSSSPQIVLLWSGDDIALALSRARMVAGLVAKYRKAVEKAVPHYSLQLERWP